jgi:hypothetical protein
MFTTAALLGPKPFLVSRDGRLICLVGKMIGMLQRHANSGHSARDIPT